MGENKSKGKSGNDNHGGCLAMLYRFILGIIFAIAMLYFLFKTIVLFAPDLVSKAEAGMYSIDRLVNDIYTFFRRLF